MLLSSLWDWSKSECRHAVTHRPSPIMHSTDENVLKTKASIIYYWGRDLRQDLDIHFADKKPGLLLKMQANNAWLSETGFTLSRLNGVYWWCVWMSICLPSCVSWESWGVCRTCRTLCRCRACQKCARACAFSCRYCWRSVCRSHRIHTWTVSLLPKKERHIDYYNTLLMFQGTSQMLSQ